MFNLSKDHAAFAESGVSIVLASRDAENRPLVGRAMGCRVAPNGERVTIFLSRRKYPLLLDAIRRSGVIAASFSEPSTNRSIQIKGVSAELVEPVSADAARIAAHLELFAAELERIGLQGALGRTVLSCAPDDYVAVAFVPAAGFKQTPGPTAGARIEP